MIHYRYAVGILLALLIGAIAVKWNDIPNLANIISFGLSIASLVLAVIAILQALQSGGSLERMQAAIAMAADRIYKSSLDIENGTAKLIAQSDRIPEELVKISTKIDGLGDFFNKPNGAPQDSHKPYLERGAAIGLIGLYLATKSFNHKKKFTMKEIFEDSIEAASVGSSFLSAWTAGTFEMEHEGGDIFTVTSLLDLDFDGLEAKISEVVTDGINLTQKNHIDHYFE